MGADFKYSRDIAPYGKNAMELELLTGIGINPIDALISATKISTQLIQQEKKLRTLEVGKLADIILIAGNPLENISIMKNPKNIKVVILNGKIVKQTDDTEKPLNL